MFSKSLILLIVLVHFRKNVQSYANFSIVCSLEHLSSSCKQFKMKVTGDVRVAPSSRPGGLTQMTPPIKRPAASTLSANTSQKTSLRPSSMSLLGGKKKNKSPMGMMTIAEPGIPAFLTTFDHTNPTVPPSFG